MCVLYLLIRHKQEDGKRENKEVRLLSYLRIFQTQRGPFSAALVCGPVQHTANMSVNVNLLLHTTEF